MNTAEKHLRKVLEELVVEFPRMRFEYEQSKYTGTYFVSVMPIQIFEEDTLFNDRICALYEELYELFPDEEFAFIKEKKPYNVTHPSFVITGVEYVGSDQMAEGEGMEVDKSAGPWDMQQVMNAFGMIIKGAKLEEGIPVKTSETKRSSTYEEIELVEPMKPTARLAA